MVQLPSHRRGLPVPPGPGGCRARNGGAPARGAEFMGTRISSVLRADAEILKYAVREAVRTSPGSFLVTVADIEAERPDYWVDEVRSSRWVVAEHDGEVVGIAGSKPPDPAVDQEDTGTARYIGSVWVAPGLRRRRLAERLVKYLLAAEYWNNPHIRQFVLWVYTDNKSAMKLYERIGFTRTPETNVGVRTE